MTRVSNLIILISERFVFIFFIVNFSVSVSKHQSYKCSLVYRSTLLAQRYRPISETVFMLSIAINRAEHVCDTVIIKHNYMLMCNHKIVINIMLCLLNSTGHI